MAYRFLGLVGMATDTREFKYGRLNRNEWIKEHGSACSCCSAKLQSQEFAEDRDAFTDNRGCHSLFCICRLRLELGVVGVRTV